MHVQAMICSNSKEERFQTLEVILKLRVNQYEQSNVGDYIHMH